jgi:hypothetical protein
MTNINRKQFQAFPYHLVEPSPWPLLTSFAMLTMAVGAVMYFHGFTHGGNLLILGFLLTLSGMILWFRDVVAEGIRWCALIIKKFNYMLVSFNIILQDILFNLSCELGDDKQSTGNFNISSKFLNKIKLDLVVFKVLRDYTLNIVRPLSEEEKKKALDLFLKYLNLMPNNQLGCYFSGLLEGDGHISLLARGHTTLTRILNPRVIFTSHIKNLGLYAYIQSHLGGIGRF